ncbi:MAG: putative Ig domain-containing protein [Desulfobacteraceae bacterium]|jgi:hypothetical protein
MKKWAVYFVFLMVVFTASITLGEPRQWSAADGGNDHWYEVIINKNAQGEPARLTWTDAKAAADAKSGNWHLVSITSAAENDFVYNLFKDDPNCWIVDLKYYNGPWIGAYRYYQPFVPVNRQFLWDNGEQFSYSNWAPSQPDGSGNYVHFWSVGYEQNTWNDQKTNTPIPVAYIVESTDWNQPPVLNPIGNKSVNEGDTLSFSISAGDADGDNLDYAAANLPAGAYFDPDTRRFEWMTDYGDAGNYKVTFTVTDDGDPVSLSDSETVTITVGGVNRPPVLAAIGAREVDEGDSLAFTISATDPDSDNLAYTAGNLPVGATFNANTRTFSWTTDSGNAGNYRVTFAVSDDGSPTLTDSETVSITVGAVNHPPVMGTIGNRLLSEGDLLEFTVTALDPDNDSLFFDAGDLPAGAVFDPVTHAFSWAPEYEDEGNHYIIFTVTDSGSPPLSDAETVTVTVGEVNRPPEMSVTRNQSVGLGELLEFAVSVFDSDNDNLLLSVSDLPVGASFDTVSRTFRWTPTNQDQDVGNHRVTFKVTDDGTPPLNVSKEVIITVGDVNRPPTFGSIGNKTIEVGQLLVFAVTATDPDNDALEFSAHGLSANASFDESRQLFYWVPTSDDIGINILRFTVVDSGTPQESDEVFVDVVVTDATAIAGEENGDEVENTEEPPNDAIIVRGGRGGAGCFIGLLGN